MSEETLESTTATATTTSAITATSAKGIVPHKSSWAAVLIGDGTNSVELVFTKRQDVYDLMSVLTDLFRAGPLDKYNA